MSTESCALDVHGSLVPISPEVGAAHGASSERGVVGPTRAASPRGRGPSQGAAPPTWRRVNREGGGTRREGALSLIPGVPSSGPGRGDQRLGRPGCGSVGRGTGRALIFLEHQALGPTPSQTPCTHHVQGRLHRWSWRRPGPRASGTNL